MVLGAYSSAMYSFIRARALDVPVVWYGVQLDLHSNSQHRRVTCYADRCGETSPRHPPGARFHQLDAAALGPARSIQWVLERDRGCTCRYAHVRLGEQRVFARGAEIDRGQEEVKRNVSPRRKQHPFHRT
jgi:hypothetical protein